MKWHVLAIGWLALAAAGLGAMAVYANRPGAPAAAPATWPASSELRRDAARPTLLVIAHPRCDCTRATLSELAEVMARAKGRVKSIVLIVKPSGTGEDWDETALWSQARAIPGVEVVRDEGGREADRFGVQTSGQALLYATNNELVFSGGLTASRGHEGTNAGERAVLEWIGGAAAAGRTSPVFGCEVFNTVRPGGAGA